jgi:hypothetical protein
MTHHKVEGHLSKQIQGLRDKVAKYQKTYDQELEGYTENMCFPNLKLPIRAGFYLPAKWIKHLNTGDISCFLAHDGPCDMPHIIPIYMSLLSSNNTPTGLIPQWFHRVLTGPHAQFLHMVECAHKFDDWGVAANILCYREYNKEFNIINTKIKQLQLDASAIEQDHALCKQQLKASRCTEGLAHLKGLGPKSICAKWGTHFTDDEDDEECTHIN